MLRPTHQGVLPRWISLGVEENTQRVVRRGVVRENPKYERQYLDHEEPLKPW